MSATDIKAKTGNFFRYLINGFTVVFICVFDSLMFLKVVKTGIDH